MDESSLVATATAEVQMKAIVPTTTEVQMDGSPLAATSVEVPMDESSLVATATAEVQTKALVATTTT